MSDRLGALSYRWLLFYFVFAAFIHFALLLKPQILPQWFQLFGFQLFLLGLLIYLYRSSWRPRLELSLKAASFFLVGVLFYFGGLALLNWMAKNSLGRPEEELYQGSTASVFALQILIAPILEEFFFRDYLMRAFYFQMRKWSHALLFSSAFFMLAHFSLYPGALILGLMSGLIYLGTRSILPCILFHLISNLSWYFLPYLFPSLFRFLIERDWLSIFYR